MKKKWVLPLVIAFALGVSIKTYLDSQAESDTPATQAVVMYGEGNQPVELFNREDNRIRLVYFGFTRCPDVCPTSLAMLAGALNQVDDSDRARLRPIFISLDPERDSAEAAAKYAHYFHRNIEGLSAPLDITTRLAHQYGVIFKKTELPDSELKYTVDHSSYFYFLKPDGTLITKVPHTQSPAPIVAAIKSVLDQEQTSPSKG